MPHYTKICAEFELVTPAFIGGANKDKASCIDPKAIKAALRYWWRVLNWPIIQKEATAIDGALACLHQAEMRLFGFASTKAHGGQGLLQVTVQHKSGLGLWRAPKKELDPGIIYLLGQGLYESENKKQKKPARMLRTALDTGTFSVTLILHCPRLGFVPQQDQTQILEALKAFGLLGNLGSRQNRGFGSVRMTKLNQNGFASDVQTYTAELRKLFTLPSPPLSLLPSFCDSARMRLVVPDQSNQIRLLARNATNYEPRPIQSNSASVTSPWQMLARIGEEFLVERSSGYAAGNGIRKTLGNFTAQCFYEEDHHWIAKAKAIGNNLAKLPRHERKESTISLASPQQMPPPVRMIYGLPYGFELGKEISVKLAEKLDGRRASPLHIHITSLDDKVVAALYTLPSVFLPEGASLHVKLCKEDEFCPDIPIAKLKFDYALIDKFLNRFTSAQNLP